MALNSEYIELLIERETTAQTKSLGGPSHVTVTALHSGGTIVFGTHRDFPYPWITPVWTIAPGESFILRLPRHVNPNSRIPSGPRLTVTRGTSQYGGTSQYTVRVNGRKVMTLCQRQWRYVAGDEIADLDEVEWILPR